MSIIHDFPSIARKLNRQEQKAEFEAKNPPVETNISGQVIGVAVPFGTSYWEAKIKERFAAGITPISTPFLELFKAKI